MSYLAAFHLPAGVMALIIALVPMFSLMIALTLRLERFRLSRMTGVVLGALAIALIALPESSLPDPSKAIFIVVALVAPFCYGIEGNYLSLRQPEHTGPVATMFGASLIGTAISLPLTLATGTFINPLQVGINASELAVIASTILHIFGLCRLYLDGQTSRTGFFCPGRLCGHTGRYFDINAGAGRRPIQLPLARTWHSAHWFVSGATQTTGVTDPVS